MHFVYVIYSLEHNRFYTGETINVANRIIEHNSGYYAGSSTSFATDWELYFMLSVNNRKDALIVEKHLKSMKSKAYLQRLKNDVEAMKKFKQIISEKYGIQCL